MSDVASSTVQTQGRTSSNFGGTVGFVAINRQPTFNLKSSLSQVGVGRSIVGYREGQIVFSVGDAADEVFYILSGKVKVLVASEQGKKSVVAIHGTNEFFGEECLPGGNARRIATVVTLTDAVIVRLEKAALVHLIHQEPAFSEMFIAYLVGRTVCLRADLIDQQFNSCEKRLARLLLRLANDGQEAKPKAMITKVSQETLADMIGTTRSRVSFFMNRFRDLGLIDYGGTYGCIEVHRSLSKAISHGQLQTKT